MLPTKKSVPITDFSQYSILLYGVPKIGKSTFCSNSEKALFIATEPGLNTLSVYKIDTLGWQEFLDACALIAEGKHDYKTIIIDTVDNLYTFCEEYICKKYGVDTPNDGVLGFGKGSALILNEFRRVLNKLASMPYGLIMTSHAYDKDVDDRTGKYTKTVPTIPDAKKNSPYRFITGFVDMILFCSQEKAKVDGELKTVRVINTKPSMSFDAGDRSGKLPAKLPLDFNKFIAYFNTATKTNTITTKKEVK